MKKTIAKIAAVMQIVVGALLLGGTVCLTGSAYRTIWEESGQLSANLAAAADAIVSARETYAQSATNLFALTGTMDDVGGKLGGMAGKLSATGELFLDISEKAKQKLDPLDKAWIKAMVPLVETVLSIAERCEKSGKILSDVGKDVSSVATALQGQGRAIDEYRDNGHEKSLAAMAETAESLRHAEAILNRNSAERWCGFVCVLGFCVSMLFFANGALMLALAREEGKAA